MKYLLLLALLFVSPTMWADDKTEAKPAEAKPAEPPKPITVSGAPQPLADIDPATLKITYRKGADPKAFAETMVKAWAESNIKLGECLKTKEEIEKKK